MNLVDNKKTRKEINKVCSCLFDKYTKLKKNNADLKRNLLSGKNQQQKADNCFRYRNKVLQGMLHANESGRLHKRCTLSVRSKVFKIFEEA